MSTLFELVAEIEARLEDGNSTSDKEWISYELNVPLAMVDEVAFNVDYELDYELRSEEEYMDIVQARDAMMA